MELIDALDQTFSHTHRIISGVNADQFDRATPCRDWNVRQLLTHTLGVVANMGHGALGEETRDIMEFPLSDDPGTQFKTIAADTLAAWRSLDLGVEVNVGAGPMPAAAAIGINLVDTLTHSWDIARATGQDETIDADLAAATLAVGQGFINEQIRSFAGIEAEVAVASDASPTERLVAFLGRQP
jgi:uncharacterized protein (TIGR03086 family)